MKQNRVITLPVFKTIVKPVAKAEWTCALCKQPIDKGMRYTHYFNRKPHEIIDYRLHNECFDVVIAYCAEKHRTTFTPRSVANWVRTKFCNDCKMGCGKLRCKKIEASVKKMLDIRFKV